MQGELESRLEAILSRIARLKGVLNPDVVKRDIAALESRSSAPDFWQDQTRARGEMQTLNNQRSRLAGWEKLIKESEDVKTLLEWTRTESDPDTVKEAEKGLQVLESDLQRQELALMLSGEFDRNGAIITIHAGAGGTEACDWAELLFRMFRRWAERKGFSSDIADILPGEGAGVKSVTALIRGDYAYGMLRSEIGVHRLVRISPFDSAKRRHTSFASCDIIPEVDDTIIIDIKDDDLRIDTYRASGHGGQHVNKTDSAVRITHLPTNIVVQCQNERSQLKNKTMCLKMLKAKLFEVEQEKRRSAIEKHYDEKGDIAWGNQIRSYVFMPYQMVKDHRTGVEVGNIQSVMDGDLDVFIEAFLAVQKSVKSV